MCTRLEQLEQATRDQIASNDQIKKWIGEGFFTIDQAAAAFPGWADTAARDFQGSLAPIMRPSLPPMRTTPSSIAKLTLPTARPI